MTEPCDASAVPPVACPSCAVRARRNQARARAPATFSEPDRTVCIYLAKGCTNKEIARLMGRSPGWVNDRLKLVFSRLDVSTRAEVAVHAAKQGWV